MARCGMIVIKIIQETDLPSPEPGPILTEHVVIYEQRFEALDIHELITRINHKPRTRNRATKKKEAAK